MTQFDAVGNDANGDGVESDDPGFSPTLISLAGVGDELRRRWFLIVLATGLGGLLAALLLMVTGGAATASTTLIVGHDPTEDPTRAIQTDLGLLSTRVVAERVIADQGLGMTADDFLSTVTASAPSSQLISITVSGDNPQQAVHRADALASAYLDFRSQIVTQQVEASAQGNEDLAASLSDQVDEINRQVDELSSQAGAQDGSRLNELVALRANLNAQIDRIRQGVRADQIALAAAIGSSGVVDPAMADPGPGRLTSLLTLATGLVGGFAAGVATVIGFSILRDRPRRRDVISRAISAPVLLSVGGVNGRRRSARDARRVVSARVAEWVRDGRWRSSQLALLSAGNEHETLVVAAALLRTLEQGGTHVTAIDLTVSGGLARRVGVASVSLDEWSARSPEKANGLCVIRPGDVPDIHRPPAALSATSATALGRPVDGGLTLAVGQVTAALGAEHIGVWADTALLLLRAGAASTEQLSGAATVVRGSGMVLVGAVLTGSDASDVSVGEQPLHVPGHFERSRVAPK